MWGLYHDLYLCLLPCVVGRTALHWAAAVNNEEAARALICHHANVDAQDEHNQTALFLAAREGSYEVAKLLLQFGKANADLPDHMECFPRDIALERQHHDIAQLIAEFAHGLAGRDGLPTLPLSQAGALMNPQASSGKSRAKKGSASARKPSARSVRGEEDGLLRHGGPHPLESGLGRVDHAVPARAKKTRGRKGPSACQSVTQSQFQSAAQLFTVLNPAGEPHFSPEQPPSYENAINGRRAQFAAMQHQQAASMGQDPRLVYHTGVAFEDPQHRFDISPEMAYPCLMPNEALGFAPPQPNGVVLQPGTYLSGGRGDADPMVHNSPTVPSCQACSPPSLSAVVQAPEAAATTAMVGPGHRGQPLSPIHRQMLQQQRKQQQHQSQNHPHQQNYQHPLQPAMISDNFDPSAYVSQAGSSVPEASAYALLTPSSATSATHSMNFQYPTPPSHHSTTDTTSPSHVKQSGSPPNGLPTPSPEEASPDQLSSLSPTLARSEWCDPVQNGSVTNTANENIKHEPAYV